MRIAVFADVHGNSLALEAVLADLGRRGADLLVNLGDCASGPLWPREATERQMALDAVTIRGNCDRAVATLPPGEMSASDRFAYDRTTPEQRAWLGGLPLTRIVAPGVLACHGTPGQDDDALIDEVRDGRIARGSPDSIAARLGSIDAKVVLCGHSHRPDAVQLPGGPLIVNPGSVGLPAYTVPKPAAFVSESGSPHARYAILETSAAGSTAVELIAVAYANEEAARRAEEGDRPDLAHGLRTGFALPP